jgi:predicted outer membrane repeat protein
LVNAEVATITKCLFLNNTAFGAGGGIWADGSIEVNGTRIVGNVADVGGGLLGSKSIMLNSCIVSGNFAGGGGGIAHKAGIDPILNRTRVVHNISVDGLQNIGLLTIIANLRSVVATTQMPGAGIFLARRSGQWGRPTPVKLPLDRTRPRKYTRISPELK